MGVMTVATGLAGVDPIRGYARSTGWPALRHICRPVVDVVNRVGDRFVHFHDRVGNQVSNFLLSIE